MHSGEGLLGRTLWHIRTGKPVAIPTTLTIPNAPRHAYRIKPLAWRLAMQRSVIVRCLARVGNDDVQYDARAVSNAWEGSTIADVDFYVNSGVSYRRTILVWVEADMSYMVYADSIDAYGSDNLHYTPDEMHPIQTPDTLFAAVDVARAYAWPKEYAEWQKQQELLARMDTNITRAAENWSVDW